jgi:hypothetical protein
MDGCWRRCYAGRMRLPALLLCMTILCAACPDGSARQAKNPELQLSVSNYGRHFVYSVAHPESVREAWIEILDRPMLLGKKSVAVQANGTLDWDWDRSPLNFYEQPEESNEGFRLCFYAFDERRASVRPVREAHFLQALQPCCSPS